MLHLTAALLSVGFLSSLSACLPAMARLAQQQLSSSTARANSWMPLALLLGSVQRLLSCWHTMVQRGPMLLDVVARTLLSLVQQLQGCGSLLMLPAAAAAARSAPLALVQAAASSSSSSSEHQLQCALFGTQHAASTLLYAMDVQQMEQLDAGVAAEVLRLQNDPAVVEMQLQLLIAWTAQLHKQHTAQQQQQQQQQQQLPPSTAEASSSTQQQQQQQQQQPRRLQPAKQQHRADLLPVPAFHRDMLQLLPGGQAYLDAVAEEAASWRLNWEENAARLRAHAGTCCRTIGQYLYRHLDSIAGQQQLSSNGLVVSGAAVKLVLELQLLASGAVQRQREQHRQQQQNLTPPQQDITDMFPVQTWNSLGLLIRALVATSRSCLPPEVLQQAGLQLLQALAAPLQQWQLSRAGDSFLHNRAVVLALPRFSDALQALVTAACGAEPTHIEGLTGEHYQRFSGVCLPLPQLPGLRILLGIQHTYL
jgi:hypothetical protein